MQSIKLKSHVGEDGVLQLQLPIGIKNTDLEVIVVFQHSKQTLNHQKQKHPKNWVILASSLKF
jgi:hypothetical protein